jgi:transposase
MAMGKRVAERQGSMWIAAGEVATGPSHPFYEQLNRILARHGFDVFVEGLCEAFYAGRTGRPSLAPGTYFRILLVGYFEGIDSERGIAWRIADSLALRNFLGYELNQSPPDHSTISRTRRLIDVETHQAVFTWVLQVLGREGLLKGKTLGVDATTLEANAALRSIVRRDTGESYQDFLHRLAVESGVETPSREDLAKLDKKRPKKGSNKDWKNPHDPDAKITKMKDGRTHLAHKAEHAVDMEMGAVVAVTIQPADRGDTESFETTLSEAMAILADVLEDPEAEPRLSPQVLSEVVADKGYHSNAVLRRQSELGIRTYISEPKRGRRNWQDKESEQKATYGNRRRIRGQRGKRLMRLRGERVERTFAHCYETGGMRRTHLRGHENILKRLVVHVAGFNLGLLMRHSTGIGKPRVLQGLLAHLPGLVFITLGLRAALKRVLRLWSSRFTEPLRRLNPFLRPAARGDLRLWGGV